MLFTKINYLAFPVLGLVAGLANRNLRRSLNGVITGTGLGFLFCFLAPVATSRPEPPGLLHFGASYIVTIFGASVSAALQLPHRRLVRTAIMGSFASLVALICLSLALRYLFPEKLRVLEAWEFMTIVFTVPALGIGTWWPVDIVDSRLRNETMSPSAESAEKPSSVSLDVSSGHSSPLN